MSTSKIYLPNDELFKQIVKESTSYSEILRRVGLSTSGGHTNKLLKQRIAELECSITHFKRTTNRFGGGQPLKNILIENSTYRNISSLKRRLINEGMLEYSCSICGITKWLGEDLTLQLDHINGVNNDHRLENLRFLCPNCHSQTDTYAGKNKP